MITVSAQIGSGDRYAAVAAILVHQRRSHNYWDGQNGVPSFCSLHRIVNTPTGPALDGGRPARAGELEGLLGAALSTAAEGWIDPHVIALAADSMVFWTPRSIQTMHFETEPSASGRYPQPALLFKVTCSSLHVWALRPNRRPQPTTPLWRAPHWNQFAGGRVCLGSTSLPGALDPCTPFAWRDAYFRSSFTGGHERTLETDLGHLAFWRTLREGTEFPSDALIPAGITAGEATR